MHILTKIFILAASAIFGGKVTYDKIEYHNAVDKCIKNSMKPDRNYCASICYEKFASNPNLVAETECFSKCVEIQEQISREDCIEKSFNDYK